MGDIATFEVANTDDFTTREIASHAFNAFRQQGAAAFQNGGSCPFIYRDFTRRRHPQGGSSRNVVIRSTEVNS
ncbi:hypothetical protein, partial [Pseudomonas aeruginosa]|uniref:hypothetical protein n=1 Tax=Pseudomonas aeruginosa TaxID=287 RepID=UPI0031B6F099